MTRLALPLLVLAACGPVNEPRPARSGPLFVCFPGTEHGGTIDGLAIDPDGGFVIAGRFEEADFGDGTRGRRDGDDGFVARYDAAGNLFWVHIQGGKRGTDRFADVEIAPDGDVIAGGLMVTPDSLGAVVDRLTPDGAVRWSAQLEPGYSSVEALALAPDGDIAIAGVHRRRMFVGRLTGDGAARWHDVFGGDDDGRGDIDVAVDPDGGTVAAGHAGGEGFVVAHTTAGEVAWRHAAAVADDELTTHGKPVLAPRAVAAAPDGTVYVAGGGYGAVFDLGGNLIDASELAGFLAAFDRDGRPLWARSFATRDGRVLDAAVLPGGDVLIGGEFMRRIDLGGSTLTAAHDYDGPDGFAARYSPTGEYRWSRRTELGSRRFDRPMRIHAVAAGARGPLVAISPGPNAGSTHHLGCVASAEPR